MTMNRNIFVILILAVLFVSCNDLVDPAIENLRYKSDTYNTPNFFLGLLTNGYARIPNKDGYSTFSDVATDDAVTNDQIANEQLTRYRQLATGQWSASNNAMDTWTSSNTGIQYMNIVLAEVDKVKFSDDDKANLMFKDRIKGEAYGLRAIFMYTLLQAHAGWANGKLLGFPIFLTEETVSTNFNIARADFNTCTAQIYQDLDSAYVRLPLDYTDITSNAAIPARYVNAGVTDYAAYNRTMGVKFLGDVSGRIVKAVRSRVALLAASPAFADGSANGSNGTWENAAVYAADIIKLKGGIAGLPSYSYGVTWYNNSTEINGLSAGSNPQEMIWRSAREDVGVTNETNNFPPTLWGNGRINPTQNLVDAFPDKNGYPITNPSATYAITDPYTNRDPRLKAFIVTNGSSLRSTTIDITGKTSDGINKLSNSTRTGYYMLKLLRQDVNLNPAGQTKQYHYTARIRYTEIYLNYAEAANEAWGPLADPKGYGFSAYDVIKAIRKRALGIATDPYLESIKSDKDAMRQLIHNERRLELCFEGFRFWDLRRWKASLSELNTSAMGISISGTVSSPIYGASVVVENRVYQSYMLYGPIPLSETLKFSNLIQNDSWK